MNEYLRDPISNGNPLEQALIRRWWHEHEHAAGRIVWEYYLEGLYVDAIWFPSDPANGEECDGKNTSTLFPLRSAKIVLCEAKRDLTPELIGQALVYSVFATNAQAILQRSILFAETGRDSMREAAKALGLSVVVGTSSLEPPNKPLLLTRIQKP